MNTFSELSAFVGKSVILTFVDGHSVRGVIVTVDLDEPQELIYEVAEVLARGPQEFEQVRPGAVCAAAPQEVLAWKGDEEKP